ncbi:MAG: hypothetical protein H6621_02810 [Halobacteriovoraceae bacterium]|nr:hypothetical protein [Halobacteriovoraceae bacterium]MCB9093975.1 hypothetical protein [Halobacteriovoraceae bacterium]
MFYLKVFWESLVQNKINGLLFVFLLFTTTFLANNESLVRSFMAQNFMNDDEKVYFQAVVEEGTNLESIKSRMTQIPGVLSFHMRSGDKLQKNIKKSLSENDIDLPEYLLEEKMNIVEVILSPELGADNRELIRKYFIRLSGIEEAVVSKVYSPNDDSAKNFIIYFLLKWMVKGITGLLFIFFCFTYFDFVKVILRKSYVYQCFQRKENIAFKSFSLGMTFLFSILLMMLWVFFNVNFLVLGLFVCYFALFYWLISRFTDFDISNQIH